MPQMRLIGTFLTVCGVFSAQELRPGENAARIAAGGTPVYRVSVTARTAKAIN